MMVRRILSAILLIAATLHGPAWGTDSDGGTESPLRFGIGARDLALGGAALARCDAVTAPFWNPARLARAQHLSLGGFHTQLYDSDAAYQYLGATFPTLDIGAFGFGIQRLGVSNIEKRDADNVLLGSFSDSRFGFYAGYGRAVGAYDIGFAVHLEHHSLDTYRATSSPGVSVALSRSLGYVTEWFHDVDVTVSAVNIVSPSLELDRESISDPAAITAAFSADLWPDWSTDHRLELSTQVTKLDGVDAQAALGLEYTYGAAVSVRGGLRGEDLSAGLGLDYRGLRFDYAVVNRDLGLLHMFALTSSFGISIDERRQVRAERREAEFQQQMHARLISRNRATVEELVAEGEEALDNGDLPRAVNSLDRALFIARNSSLDTTRVLRLYDAASERLEQTQLMARYKRHLDSAKARFRVNDLLGAQYHATLAVEAFSGSQEARDILEDVREQLRSDSTRDNIVDRQIRQIDSLLTYGHYEEAVSRAKSLNEAAPEDEVVNQLVKRAQFEQLRHLGDMAFSAGRYDEAKNLVERADRILPDHQWSIQLRGRINEARRALAANPTVEEPLAPTELSETMRDQVEELYGSAKASFESGRLEDAVAEWERVEQLAPEYKSVRRYLVKAYKYLGVERYGESELSRAIAMWRRAAELAPDNEEILAYIKRAESEMSRLKELSYEQ